MKKITSLIAALALVLSLGCAGIQAPERDKEYYKDLITATSSAIILSWPEEAEDIKRLANTMKMYIDTGVSYEVVVEAMKIFLAEKAPDLTPEQLEAYNDLISLMLKYFKAPGEVTPADDKVTVDDPV